MEKVKIEISYSKGKTILLKDTFLGAIEMMLTNETLQKYEPLKLIFPEWNKVMCFDRALFASYYNGDITYEEVIEKALCDQMYRNISDIEVEATLVDPGSLWMLKGDVLTLIDDDQHVTIPFDRKGFEIAE